MLLAAHRDDRVVSVLYSTPQLEHFRVLLTEFATDDTESPHRSKSIDCLAVRLRISQSHPSVSVQEGLYIDLMATEH